MNSANKIFEKELLAKSTTDNLAVIRDFIKFTEFAVIGTRHIADPEVLIPILDLQNRG